MMAKRILVPLDTSERSESVFPLVGDLARGAGGTVRLFHVTPCLRTRFSADNRVILYGHQLEERNAADAAIWLRDLEPLLDGVTLEHHVCIGDPAEEIVREADAFGADVVVLAARRHPWWRRALGRVAARVRAQSDVPVLLLSDGGAR
jgi:nucleotide-binding universal stress UspA family protein